MTRLILCRGIGEPLHTGLLSRLPGLLAADHIDLPWTAQYGPVGREGPAGESFERSLAAGTRLLRAELDRGPAIVVGYSGGAALAGNLAKTGHRNLVAVGLVADPLDPGTARTHGIAGRRPITGPPVHRLRNLDDVICSCPADSPLRAIADTSAAFSLADPAAWGRDVLARLAARQVASILVQPAVYQRAYLDACRYLGVNPAAPWQQGRCAHTAYDLDPLADRLRPHL